MAANLVQRRMNLWGLVQAFGDLFDGAVPRVGATAGNLERSWPVFAQMARGDRPARPPSGRRRWTSFVVDDTSPGKTVRGLHEATNPSHRPRVEHDQYTLRIHLSDEDGHGWTTIAVDRATRRSAIAQGVRQSDTAHSAYENLYKFEAR